VNSEELELSLRTEFESYLKNVLADMRQEVSDFQKQFEAEFEKHKVQLDEVFQNFSARVAPDKQLDANFSETVIEHLRLSRDEGARITATAIAEAEEMEKENAAANVVAVAPSVGISEIRDAINDISTKTTQSAILKTLVQQAAQFTPRGAFFIIKNEHFVGWRVFGKDGENADEEAVREVFFPVAASTVLGESVRSLAAVESSYGTYSDDSIYLNKLEFGQPDEMFAVPLVVRGRSVAVLYADQGLDGEKVNVEALETLVRVASLTVEILASSRGTQTQAEESAATETVQSSDNQESTEPHSFETSNENDSETVTEAQSEETVEESMPVEADSYHVAETEAVEDSHQLAETEADVEAEEKPSETEESVEEEYSYKPIEHPAQSFEEPVYQTPVESDSFSFKPSVEEETIPSEFGVEEETIPSEFVSETSDNQFEEVSTPKAEFEEEEEKFHISPEAQTFEDAPAWSQTVETNDYYSNESSLNAETAETPSYEISEPQTFETETPVEEVEQTPELSNDYQFETNQSFESMPVEFEETSPQTFETPSYETPQYEAESLPATNGSSYDSVVTENGKAESYVAEPAETVAESVVKQPAKSRFSERNVDLPIEVSEDERRLHNDARRFARLLVSEIKLYNEQKVKEGRESSELYEKLREAIDRSREMYDKRVQPPVAAKFDYFHYELVSNLAEGDENKLGASYPGTSV
jgi:hypothetical protein